jgi:hypothetical protein
MAKIDDYQIENVYQGGYSSLNPDEGDFFTGYRMPIGNIGAPTGIQTANVLKEINQRINEGVAPIELQPIQEGIFDQIPKQHFTEAKRMAKLTGTKLSLHAPMIEPSGIDPEQKRPWDETYRKLAEKQLEDVVKKSMDLSDTESVPIVIHASGIPGTEFKMTPNGKKVEKLIAIDQESGKMTPLEEETLYYPDMKELRNNLTQNKIKKYQEGKIDENEIFKKISLDKGSIKTPEKRLEILNNSQWDNSVSQVLFGNEKAGEILERNAHLISNLVDEKGNLKISKEEIQNSPVNLQAYNNYTNAIEHIEDTKQQLDNLFHKAYKYGDQNQKQKLKKLSEQFSTNLKEDSSVGGRLDAIQNLIINLKNHEFAPNVYTSIDKFALNKSAQTFANVAFNAFEESKKQNKKAPKIAIENFQPGTSFSMKGEGEIPGIDTLIIESRKKFVEKAVSKGISEFQAKKQAEEIIGMTFDVGHINIAKKKGFTDENIKKEAKAFSKYVKHMHLTDNFGYSDSHLAPGMGNVPMKKILEELEKAGTLKDTRKIVEAGTFVQHFGTSPLNYTLEAFGSPIYSDGVGPYWNQTIGLQQGYFGGQGMVLPNINYETFGAGFSQLPIELGGQRGGGSGGRMSGKPME